MELKTPETRALVLVQGGRTDGPSRPERRAPEPLPGGFGITERERCTLFATELRLAIVARAGTKRLRPAAILSVVARVLGMLAATAVHDRDRLAFVVDELHDEVRDAAAQTFAQRETP